MTDFNAKNIAAKKPCKKVAFGQIGKAFEAKWPPSPPTQSQFREAMIMRRRVR